MEGSRGGEISRRVDVVKGTPFRINCAEFLQRNHTHPERRVIGQPLDFKVLRPNERLHDGKTIAMIERVHRLQSLLKLGHDHVALAFQLKEMPFR